MKKNEFVSKLEDCCDLIRHYAEENTTPSRLQVFVNPYVPASKLAGLIMKHMLANPPNPNLVFTDHYYNDSDFFDKLEEQLMDVFSAVFDNFDNQEDALRFTNSICDDVMVLWQLNGFVATPDDSCLIILRQTIQRHILRMLNIATEVSNKELEQYK
jgi:hypothetical protein